MRYEYIVWGIPPGADSEQVLRTQDATLGSAEYMAKWLTENKGCRECRIQVLDTLADPGQAFRDAVQS